MNRFLPLAAMMAALLIFFGCDAVTPSAGPDLGIAAPLADLQGDDDCEDDDLGGDDDGCSASVTGDGTMNVDRIHNHRHLRATFWLDAQTCVGEDDLGGGDDDCEDDDLGRGGDDGGSEGGSLSADIFNNDGSFFGSFEADLACVEIDGATAWVAGEITAADGLAAPYVGRGVFARAHDDGGPDSGSDALLVRSSPSYDVNDAEADCRDRNGDGSPFALKSGDIAISVGGGDD